MVLMAGFRLTGEADRDIRALYRYSYENFGPAQADAYVQSLEDCLALLSENPVLGRNFAAVRPGLRRHEHKSHVIYYLDAGDFILVLRILGAMQDPARHL